VKTSSSHAFVNSLVVYSLVAIGCTGSVGLGMVWSRRQISVLAQENKALATRIAEIDRLSQELGAEIAEQQDPAALLQRNAQLRLGLVQASPDRQSRLTEDAAIHLASKRNEGLYSDRGAAVSFRVAAQP
jgi:Tfp pilus assembly protein PilN